MRIRRSTLRWMECRWANARAALQEENRLLHKLLNARGVWLLRLKLLVFASLLAASTNQAATRTASWVASPDTNVTGYVLYWGNLPHVYTNYVRTTNLTVTLTNLACGTNYFAVAAEVDLGNGATQQSDPSDELMYVVRPASPTQLKISFNLESSTDPAGPWKPMVSVSSQVDVATGQKFYRGTLGITP